ncbi:unnamed protein product [Durusdinium trenchii]|uniref:Uncharacterized protein n=1 Tax=Durusdinium trenchii TaxID=1381693 RepID=A0ABP0JVR8_9DINO
MCVCVLNILHIPEAIYSFRFRGSKSSPCTSHLRQCLLQSMPRELRVDYAGNSFRWFDTDEMLRVHGADLSNFLAKSIEEHFKVPLHFQVLCDIEGPLTSGDFQRLLQNEAPKLWLFDARYMPEDLRKQCEERTRLARPSGCLPNGAKLETLVEEKSDTQAELSSLSEREKQVAQLLSEREAEIQQLQRELNSWPLTPVDEDETSLQMLEAEEAMLVQSVQEALARISAHRTPTLRSSTGVSVQRTFCSETELTTASPFSLREKPRSSGPLPPLESDGCRVCGSDDKERSARHTLRQQLAAAEEAHTTQELRVTEWQTRAKSADAALLEEQTEFAHAQLQWKLEMDLAMRDKDLAHVQELREIQSRIHQSELRHQAEVLTLRHRVANCAEQEEWQQMELLLLKTQQKRSERAQEQELQELLSSVELERLTGEQRASELSSKTRQEKDLAARLAGCGLEILALENAIEALPVRLDGGVDECLRKAEEESSRLASELQQEAEMLRREELAQQVQLAEMTRLHQREEEQSRAAAEARAREETLELQLQQLESQLEAALKAPAPELPKVEERKSDYISTADDELDKALEKEIFELGPGVLKGLSLERTGPKRYKFREQKVYMQLTDSKVTVRVGVNYIPLAQWTKELFTNAEDPFSTLDAQSPFANVR